MSAWLLRAVACGFLLAVPAIGAAQEQPPKKSEMKTKRHEE